MLNHNKNFNKGLNEDGEKVFNFPELLVGGGIIYLEAFLEGEQPTGNTGIFVKAIGKPTFVRTEWTDFDYNPLEKKDISYGSEILLHVYTKDLYNLDIEVQLFDKEKIFADRRLNISDQWAFQRKVKKVEVLSFEKGEKGVGGSLTDTNTKNSTSYVQKVTIKVKIESVWEYIVKGFFENIDIEIFAKVFYKKEELPILIESPLLIVKENGKLYDEPEEVTNQPVLVEDSSLESQINEENLIHFTFGVFLDGTLNNMYNTELRQKVEEARNKNATIAVKDSAKEANSIYKDMSSKKVYKNPEEGSSSAENDLSNPAILFKNYTENKTNRIFRVYTEGIGTNTAPKEQGAVLSKEDYKKDDLMQGPAFGIGSAGIKDRVRKAIDDVVKYITANLDTDTNQLGTITFDVFGFSRGAAAARHFVHVVKYSAYPAKTYNGRENYSVNDIFGYTISTKYANQLMPEFGYLGQLLSELELLNIRTKVDVRFVGIYDTVPHHGLFQWNDIKDLGLDDVNKANYVVHMIAGDEHRANFSLVDISSVNKVAPESGQKGGLEVIYPGVHCDVGGAYIEGWGENPERIDGAATSESLEPLRKELIHQGWFKEKQIYIKFDPFSLRIIPQNVFRLEGERKSLSNQYSFIPLHLMNETIKKRSLSIINESELMKYYGFKENTFIIIKEGNIKFLEGIKSILHKQTFEGGKPLTFKEYEVYKEPPVFHTPEDTKASDDWLKRQQEGQAKLDEKTDKENETIKFLRNHYLHWNSTYSIANSPNIEEIDKVKVRKRHIR